MRNQRSELLQVRYEYADPTQHERARALLVVSVGLFGLTMLFGAVLVATEIGQPTGGLRSSLLILGVAILAMLVIYVLAQVGQVTLGSVVFVASLVLANYLVNLPRGAANNSALVGWALPVVAAGLLLGARASLLTATASMALIGSLAWVEFQSTPTAERGSLIGDLAFSFTVTGIVLYSIALVSWLFAGSVQQRAREAFRRAAQLHATSEVSQAATTARDLPSLLNDVVDLISRAFDFYHVQIFLVDETGQQALLRASTGEPGRQLLARGHRLPVGSQSVIGQVTARGEPIIASDVSEDPVHRRNELLPNTRSEMALPLRVSEQVIGALDVQSTEANAFGAEDVETLQVMANQLAAAIEKARLLEEVQGRASENERLLEEAQASLRQIETLNRALTREGWREYLRKRAGRGTLGYTLQGDRIVEDTHWTTDMRDAFNEQRVVVREDGEGDEQKTLSLPLTVRGEVIGVVEVERESQRAWTEDDVELAEVLAERLSSALENTRLLEQADTLARRERLVNEITHSVQRAESVDDVLQAALVELGRALGASRGVVQLSPKRDAGHPTSDSGRQRDEDSPPVPADSVASEEGQS